MNKRLIAFGIIIITLALILNVIHLSVVQAEHNKTLYLPTKIRLKTDEVVKYVSAKCGNKAGTSIRSILNRNNGILNFNKKTKLYSNDRCAIYSMPAKYTFIVDDITNKAQIIKHNLTNWEILATVDTSNDKIVFLQDNQRQTFIFINKTLINPVEYIHMVSNMSANYNIIPVKIVNIPPNAIPELMLLDIATKHPSLFNIEVESDGSTQFIPLMKLLPMHTAIVIHKWKPLFIGTESQNLIPVLPYLPDISMENSNRVLTIDKNDEYNANVIYHAIALAAKPRIRGDKLILQFKPYSINTAENDLIWNYWEENVLVDGTVKLYISNNGNQQIIPVSFKNAHLQRYMKITNNIFKEYQNAIVGDVYLTFRMGEKKVYVHWHNSVVDNEDWGSAQDLIRETKKHNEIAVKAAIDTNKIINLDLCTKARIGDGWTPICFTQADIACIRAGYNMVVESFNMVAKFLNVNDIKLHVSMRVKGVKNVVVTDDKGNIVYQKTLEESSLPFVIAFERVFSDFRPAPTIKNGVLYQPAADIKLTFNFTPYKGKEYNFTPKIHIPENYYPQLEVTQNGNTYSITARDNDGNLEKVAIYVNNELQDVFIVTGYVWTKTWTNPKPGAKIKIIVWDNQMATDSWSN